MRAGEDLGRLQILDADLNYIDEWPHMPRIGSIQISKSLFLLLRVPNRSTVEPPFWPPLLLLDTP